MLDCGLRPGKTADNSYPSYELWDKSIDAIVITHAHIDHSGSVARAHALWPDAMIISTSGTKGFLEPLLHDMSIGSNALEEIELMPIEVSVAIETYKAIISVAYGEWVSIADNVKIRLHQAGHLFGAAMVEIVLYNSSVVYTGDFCMHGQELCSGAMLAELPHAPDLLICEATYLHETNRRDWFLQRECLKNAIAHAVSMNKTVLLPSTAYGRSQEVLCIIADMIRECVIPKETPLYIGGFSCKTCAALEGLLGDSYLEIMDRSAPLTANTTQ